MSSSPIRKVSSFTSASLILGLLGGGCVSTSLELTPDHPARPTDSRISQAEPAALLRSGLELYASPGSSYAPSTGLRSTESPAQEVVQAEPDGSREAPFVGRGVVQQISASRIEIQHGDIPGFMPAMTMAFPVADEIEDSAAEVGAEIIFHVEFTSSGFQIFHVEEVDAHAEETPAGGMDHNHGAPSSEPEG